MRRLVAVAMLCLWVGVAVLPATASAQRTTAESEAPLRLSDAGRVRINFNRNWRFAFGSTAGAAAPGFEDAGWQRVGLPHSFATPYFQSRAFPEGEGWYRKHLTLSRLATGRRLSLEFEGAFQVAEVFVNGRRVGGHRGGYTGFAIDVTDAVRAGDNVIAVRVDNRWNARLAPRAGEHVFAGGLYRDVWLVATDAVHVPWTGTSVTTPELSAASGRVRVATEVRNDAARPAGVTAHTVILDDGGRTVTVLPDRTATVAPGALAVFDQLSTPVVRPRLWSPEAPALYRSVTTLTVDGVPRDRFETVFGFRWFEWTADRGFFLNGRHRYLKGANVHQDQAGWGDAVANSAMARDVAMMKEAGFDIIRGSHYPHDPAFTDATDRLGMMYLSENPFWGIGGFRDGAKWNSPAYPTDPADRPAFEASLRQQLAEMIRIHRNHPSIVGWSMGNEAFFSTPETMPEVRRTLSELVALSHRLDPTRPAVIGGAQRGAVDRLGDVAGYNGDGATLFLDPGIPSLVTEYGSVMTHRPGDYAPGWGELENAKGVRKGDPASWRFAWRSGEIVWAGFDHGSIAGKTFGSMGIVDYARLPKRSWYWYRNAYRGIAPPAWPTAGEPAALRLTASSAAIARADGTEDVRLTVTVVDRNGRAISNSPPVRLTVESGPGELPTGRSIDFTPDGDIPIRDGQAAIAMRSWYAGPTRLRATSPGLADAVLTIDTLDGPRFQPGITPLPEDRPYRRQVESDEVTGESVYGVDNPTAASSSAPGSSPPLAADGDPTTSWRAASDDKAPWLSISPEKLLRFRRIEIQFDRDGHYGFVAEIPQAGGGWRMLARQEPGAVSGARRAIDTPPLVAPQLRIRLLAAPGEPLPGIAEIRMIGTPQTQ